MLHPRDRTIEWKRVGERLHIGLHGGHRLSVLVIAQHPIDERAYLFVLSALEHSQTRLVERRHISGPELAHACRELALQRFGVMARVVLEHWGMRSTMDIGDIVFTLVDLGLLISQAQDSRNDFYGVFDFEDAFEREYPWSTAHV